MSETVIKKENEIDVLINKFINRKIFGFENTSFFVPLKEKDQREFVYDWGNRPEIYEGFLKHYYEDKKALDKFISQKTKQKIDHNFISVSGNGLVIMRPDIDLIQPIIKIEDERAFNVSDYFNLLYTYSVFNDSFVDKLKDCYAGSLAEADVFENLDEYINGKNQQFFKDLKDVGNTAFVSLNDDLKVFYEDLKTFDFSKEMTTLPSYKKCLNSLNILNILAKDLLIDRLDLYFKNEKELFDEKSMELLYNNLANTLTSSNNFPSLFNFIDYNLKDINKTFIGNIQNCFSFDKEQNVCIFSNKDFKKVVSDELSLMENDESFNIKELIKSTFESPKEAEEVEFMFNMFIENFNKAKDNITSELREVVEELNNSKKFESETIDITDESRDVALLKKTYEIMEKTLKLERVYDEFCTGIFFYNQLGNEDKLTLVEKFEMMDFKDYNVSFQESGVLPVEKKEISTKTQIDSEFLDNFFKKDFDAYFSKVIGQKDAIQAIRGCIEDVYLNRVPRKPLASLMFLGPTGVGKSMTAEIIGEYLFDDRKRICKIQMQQNAEKTNWQLIGTPHGYVGSGNKPELIQFIEDNPTGGVIVLEEFEKASDVARRVFMQMLDEGEFTDVNGVKYDITNFVIIATSNAVIDKNVRKIGFSNGPEDINKDQVQLRDAIVNAGIEREQQGRFAVPVYFKVLSKEDVKLVADQMLNNYLKNKSENCKNILGYKVNFIVEDKNQFCEYVANNATSPESGARMILDFIKQTLDFPVNALVKQGKEAKNVLISVVDGKIDVKQISKNKAQEIEVKNNPNADNTNSINGK